MPESVKDHWDRVYSLQGRQAVSWFQPHAERSVRMIGETGVTTAAPIIDVGGGSSTLVDDLIEGGYTAVTILDISAAALASAMARLGARSGLVRWLEADITTAVLPEAAYELWHDRAVFHFLTAPGQRAAYVERMFRALKPGGYAIVATFAQDGPTRCSGLPVVRYSPETLQAALGPSFELLGYENEDHRAPSGVLQRFVYCRFRKAMA